MGSARMDSVRMVPVRMVLQPAAATTTTTMATMTTTTTTTIQFLRSRATASAISRSSPYKSLFSHLLFKGEGTPSAMAGQAIYYFKIKFKRSLKI